MRKEQRMRRPVKRVRIPKKLKRADFLRKRIRVSHSKGDFDPVLDWLEANRRSVPNGEAVLFDESGRNISLENIECGRTYFAMVFEYRWVNNCPSLGVLLPMINRTLAAALSAADEIAERCRQRPSCDAIIRFQARAWDCTRFRNPFRWPPCEVHAGHCFRIDCIET